MRTYRLLFTVNRRNDGMVQISAGQYQSDGFFIARFGAAMVREDEDVNEKTDNQVQ